MDDGVPLRDLAAELVGIYLDARTIEDEEYAAAAIDDLLDAVGEVDDDVLLTLLDLPETELTVPLLDDAVSMLAEAGRRVVGRLLEAIAPAREPRAGHALEALDRMDRPEVARGFLAVLTGDDVTGLRLLAADGLVALGADAARLLDDALADPWTSQLAQTALDRREGGSALRLSPAASGSGLVDAEALEEAFRLEPREPGRDPAGQAGTASAEPPGDSEPPPTAPGDITALDDERAREYEEFLERFERESDL
jgi:hypothetical protein